MDPTSTAIGTVSLITLFSLFSVCTQRFEHIEYARRFGDHYESSVLKLDVCKLRLNRWAQSIDLLDNEPGQVSSLEGQLSAREAAIIQDLLGNIAEAFENVQKLSRRHQRTQKLINADAEAEGLHVMYIAELSSRFKRIHMRTEATTQSRQDSTGQLENARCTLYERKRLDDLVRDIRDHTDALVEAFPHLTPLQKHLANIEVTELTADAHDRALLKTAAEDIDPLLVEAVENATITYDGHHLDDIRPSGNARVFLSNDVAYGAAVRRRTYDSVVADGNAIVHVGDLYRF